MIFKETKQILRKKFPATAEIAVIEIDDKEVAYQVPYDSSIFDIELEGETVQEQVDHFVSQVTERIRDMVDHLESFL
jgi:CO dehydrogenase nickel-insertion accessory protein CooC1